MHRAHVAWEQSHRQRSRSIVKAMRCSRGEQAAAHIPQAPRANAIRGGNTDSSLSQMSWDETTSQRTPGRAGTKSRDFKMVPRFMRWAFGSKNLRVFVSPE